MLLGAVVGGLGRAGGVVLVQEGVHEGLGFHGFYLSLFDNKKRMM